MFSAGRRSKTVCSWLQMGLLNFLMISMMELVFFFFFFQVFVSKESACNAGDMGSIPGLGRFPGEGNGYPLQYAGLENSMHYIVHGVGKNEIGLSDFHFHFW